MLNRWEGIGNLGKDPELRYTTGQNPTAVCRFTIAVKNGYGDREKTVWMPVVVFGKRAESCSKYLAKGKKVYVAGEIDIREWDKQDGTKGYITECNASEVEFLTPKEQNDGFGYTYPPAQPMQQPVQQPQYAPVQQTQTAMQPQFQQPPQGQQMQYDPNQPPPMIDNSGQFTALRDDDIPFK